MELLFTLETWLFCLTARYALGKDAFPVTFSREQNGIVVGSAGSLSGKCTLDHIHAQLGTASPFSRGIDGMYSHWSTDGRLLVQIDEKVQRIVINKPTSLDTLALQNIQQLLVLERRRSNWVIIRSVHKSYFEQNVLLLEPLAELLHERQGASGRYIGAGVMFQSNADTKWLSDLLVTYFKRKNEWEELNKLVVQPGKEKSKKFKKRTKEEEEPTVSAEILEDGSVIVETSLESKEEAAYSEEENKPN